MVIIVWSLGPWPAQRKSVGATDAADAAPRWPQSCKKRTINISMGRANQLDCESFLVISELAA